MDERVSDPLRDRVANLGLWFGRVDPVPLAGGITNKNFVVEDRGRKYVVRTGGDILVHGIVRASELAAARAAEAAGISPAVIHAEPGIMVIDFIEGRTFAPEDVRNPSNFDGLVDLVKRCHRDVALHLRGPASMFWPFHVIRDYAHTLREGQSRHGPLLTDLLDRSARLERAVGPIDIVFGHNDLLAANVLDDGKRLWLLDWDYAGFNSPLFDLGGLASNSEMPAEMAEAFVSAYFGRPVDDELRRKAAAMTAVSLLRETLWAMVSEIHSTVDFDYAAYTAENLSRFEASYARYKTME
ncbi:phosphotransferase [Hyphomicrobium sp.]|uniref:phosphotransferase n=1 Tax=Hyphomicrobium sp. TaxID=82 RepID=UPI002E364E42|nr:phosphotransferase [Hyphomicrobium sp.]HEX2840865.1 phosphotransferase [Hyphomicrobium sp.]